MLRSQHVEATRRAVLAAARSSFGRKGYTQTSIDEIAAAARVTKGAVYHHFAGKKALFRAVYSEVEAEAQARTAGAVDPGGSPIDQIVAGVNAYLDVALDEEIQRITLVDGPVVLGLEPEGPAEEQAGYVALRFFIATAITSTSSASASLPAARNADASRRAADGSSGASDCAFFAYSTAVLGWPAASAQLAARRR